jgi:hypothetical protein
MDGHQCILVLMRVILIDSADQQYLAGIAWVITPQLFCFAEEDLYGFW